MDFERKFELVKLNEFLDRPAGISVRPVYQGMFMRMYLEGSISDGNMLVAEYPEGYFEYVKYDYEDDLVEVVYQYYSDKPMLSSELRGRDLKIDVGSYNKCDGILNLVHLSGTDVVDKAVKLFHSYFGRRPPELTKFLCLDAMPHQISIIQSGKRVLKAPMFSTIPNRFDAELTSFEPDFEVEFKSLNQKKTSAFHTKLSGSPQAKVVLEIDSEHRRTVEIVRGRDVLLRIDV